MSGLTVMALSEHSLKFSRHDSNNVLACLDNSLGNVWNCLTTV